MGVFPVPPALCPPGSLGREGKHKLQATTRSRPLQAVLIYVLTHKALPCPTETGTDTGQRDKVCPCLAAVKLL